MIDPPLAEHLAECGDCATRYGALASFMKDLRDEADVETDAVFPADRLEAQRDQIARRLEQLGHAARVIAFPARASDVAGPMAPPARAASRWVAAAAVAGLFVGLVLGAFSNVATQLVPVEIAISQPPPGAGLAVPTATADAATPLRPMDDDTFLRELEVARGRQRTRALMPLDAFTPSIQEVNAQLR